MPQGNYPNFDPRNPTLLPNFDVPVANPTGNTSSLGLQSPAQYLANFPQVNATATATVAGTITNGDTIVIKVTSGVLAGGNIALPGGILTLPTVNVITGDTVSSIAEKIAKVINDSATLKLFRVFADVTAAGVVTISWPGPVGNFATFSANITGTETVTFAPVSGTLSGGSGPIVPLQNFEWSTGSQTFALWANQPTNISYDQVGLMVSQGMQIS